MKPWRGIISFGGMAPWVKPWPATVSDRLRWGPLDRLRALARGANGLNALTRIWLRFPRPAAAPCHTFIYNLFSGASSHTVMNLGVKGWEPTPSMPSAHRIPGRKGSGTHFSGTVIRLGAWASAPWRAPALQVSAAGASNALVQSGSRYGDLGGAGTTRSGSASGTGPVIYRLSKVGHGVGRNSDARGRLRDGANHPPLALQLSRLGSIASMTSAQAFRPGRFAFPASGPYRIGNRQVSEGQRSPGLPGQSTVTGLRRASNESTAADTFHPIARNSHTAPAASFPAAGISSFPLRFSDWKSTGAFLTMSGRPRHALSPATPKATSGYIGEIAGFPTRAGGHIPKPARPGLRFATSASNGFRDLSRNARPTGSEGFGDLRSAMPMAGSRAGLAGAKVGPSDTRSLDRALDRSLELLRRKVKASEKNAPEETLGKATEEKIERSILKRVEALVSRQLAPDSPPMRRLGERIYNGLYEGMVFEKERLGSG